jgi:hypothetical protein
VASTTASLDAAAAHNLPAIAGAYCLLFDHLTCVLDTPQHPTSHRCQARCTDRTQLAGIWQQLQTSSSLQEQSEKANNQLSDCCSYLSSTWPSGSSDSSGAGDSSKSAAYAATARLDLQAAAAAAAAETEAAAFKNVAAGAAVALPHFRMSAAAAAARQAAGVFRLVQLS